MRNRARATVCLRATAQDAEVDTFRVVRRHDTEMVRDETPAVLVDAQRLDAISGRRMRPNQPLVRGLSTGLSGDRLADDIDCDRGFVVQDIALGQAFAGA